MGILREPADFVRDLVPKLPPKFTVCELGDQWVTYGSPHILARDFYKQLGCGRYDSIDGNGRGTITWDLNQKWRGTKRYHLVTDFGTGEHVFNQAQVWRTIHELCQQDGYIVFDRPHAGYPEHCYYNIHKCVLDDLAAANEYRVLRLEHGVTVRGELWRGVFQKVYGRSFRIPQQGRYKKLLRPICPS
jgi:hypothetical protein